MDKPQIICNTFTNPMYFFRRTGLALFFAFASKTLATICVPETLVKFEGSPEAFRRVWTKDLIHRGVKALHEENTNRMLLGQDPIPLNGSKIGKDESIATKKILEQALGFSVTGKTFYLASVRNKFHWKEIVKIEGISKRELQLPRFWNQTEIIRGLKALKTKNEELSQLGKPLIVFSRSSLKSANPIIEQVLSELYGKEITGSDFERALFRYFPNLESALTAADLDPNGLNIHSRLTPELIIKAVRAIYLKNASLKAAGEPLIALDSAHIRNDETELTKKTIAEALPGFREMTGRSLYRAAIYHFKDLGAWTTALIKGRPYKRWKTEEIIAAVKAIHRTNKVRETYINFGWYPIPLNSKAMKLDVSLRTIRVLEKELGEKVTGAALWGVASSRFGTWSDALTAAGINANDVRELTFWKPGEADFAISALIAKSRESTNKGGEPLIGFQLMLSGTNQISDLIEKALGRKVKGSTLAERGKFEHGGWRKALLANGATEDELPTINWKSKTLSDRLVNIPTQREFVKNADDSSSGGNLIGRPPKQAVDEYLEQELKDTIRIMIENQSPDDREILSAMIDIMVSSGTRPSLSEMEEGVVKSLSRTERIPLIKIEDLYELLEIKLSEFRE